MNEGTFMYWMMAPLTRPTRAPRSSVAATVRPTGRPQTFAMKPVAVEARPFSTRPRKERPRAGHCPAPPTSGKAAPADHARGDRVQKIGIALNGVDSVQLRTEQNACDGRAEPRKCIDEKFQSVDVDSLLPHDRLIAAEGIDTVSRRSELGDEDPDSHHHEQEKVRDRDAEKRSISNVHVRGWETTDRAAVVHDERQSLADLPDN